MLSEILGQCERFNRKRSRNVGQCLHKLIDVWFSEEFSSYSVRNNWSK